MNIINLKRDLRFTALKAKVNFPLDKPVRRQIINDTVDKLVKEHHLSQEDDNKLTDYAIKLHPKN